MAASSPQTQNLEYLYALNANVSNFVSVKLSGKYNYHGWKKQMLCLMEAYNMRDLVDEVFIDGPRASSERIRKQYDNLLKGWIFGSISEGILSTVVDLDSAKDVWDTLKDLYELRSAKDFAQKKPEAKEETKDEDAVSQEMETKGEVTSSTSLVELSVDAETMTEEQKKEMNERNKRLLKAIMKQPWWYVEEIMLEGQKNRRDVMRDPIDSDKNTMLHIAVRLSRNNLVVYLLDWITEEQEKEAILEMRNVDGSTALHVAAIVGNKIGALLLVKAHNKLLTILDDYQKDPLEIAYSNMQFETFIYLLQAANEYKTKEANSQDLDDHMTELGVNVLVNAISAKEYGIASKLLESFPKLAMEKDNRVLMALARTFPSELNHWETLIYPSLGDIHERVNKRTTWLRSMYDHFVCGILLECDEARTLLIGLPCERYVT